MRLKTPARKLCECGCGKPTGIATQTERGRVSGHSMRFVPGHNSNQVVITDEMRRKISVAMTGISRNKGVKHGAWKGDAVGYRALHHWVSKWKKKTGKCSTCSHQGYTEWANISGLYFRDLNDFAEMCKVCHKEFDSYLSLTMETPKGSTLVSLGEV